MIVGYGSPSAVISGSVSASLRRVSSASSARASTHSLSSAETPSRRREAWAARPGTVSRNVIAPAWATTTSRSDGSVMIARSPVAPARIAASVPWPPSSSDGTRATSSSPASRSRSPRGAERPDGAPGSRRRRPSCRRRRARTARPSRISPPHGSAVQVAGSPGGTTSRWPDRTTRRPPARPARPMTTGSDVRGISSPGQSGSARTAAGSGRRRLDGQPELAQRVGGPRRRPPPRSPVMLGIRISACRSATSRAPIDRRRARCAPPPAAASATQHRPGHAGRPARAVDADLGRRVGVDLAAGRGERRRSSAGCPRPGSRRRAGRPARCSRASGTPRRAPRPAGCRARPGAATARRAAAAGRRRPGRRRPAR